MGMPVLNFPGNLIHSAGKVITSVISYRRKRPILRTDVPAGHYCSFAPQNGFCGYHEFFGPQSSPTIYAAIPYTSVDPGLCGVPGFNGTYANGDYDADTTISVTSHEQMEAATDPLLNAWHVPLYPNGDGYEIADKCSSQFDTLNPDGSNVNWNGHPYIVQEEWDNTISRCVLYGP